MRWRNSVIGLLLGLTVAASAGATPPPDVDVLPVTQGPAFGGLQSPLRPGASLGGYCTFNFVFAGPGAEPGTPPRAYIGTAGHCTERLGERVRLGTDGPRIGTVVYDSDVAGTALDFALIRIDRRFVGRTNPRMLGADGPYGVVNRRMLSVADRLDLYGTGVVFGDVPATRHRVGALTGWDRREYAADLPSVNGDSGAPLLHFPTGRALGIVSRYGVTGLPASTDVGPLVGWILREVRAAGFAVSLATV